MSEPTQAIEQFMQALKADDAAQVRAILDRHPEFRDRINEPLGPFDSPVITCVRSREMIDVLLAAGADLNAKSTWWAGGFGVLHSADPELAAYAIGRGAAVDVHAAARLGMLEKLQELVSGDRGLVHSRGGDGQTPLHFASSIDIAAYLLDRGADIDALDVDHESTPAQYMVEDRQEIARYLIGRGCKTDILMATAVGNIDLVREKLDADADSIRTCVSDEYFPMIGGKTGGTIYQWSLGWYVLAHQVAKKFGHDPILKLLFVRSPAAIKLIAACWLQDDATVQAVRSSHANLANEFTAADRRHVAHAARNNATAVVRRLLECGLPVTSTSQHQATPLHWAAFHGNLEMIKIILPFGPPLEVADADFNGTPLGWAIYGSEHGWNCDEGDYGGTVETLLAAGAKRLGAIGGSPAVQEVLRR